MANSQRPTQPSRPERIAAAVKALHGAAQASETRFHSIAMRLEAGLGLLARMQHECERLQSEWEAADPARAERDLRELVGQVGELFDVGRHDAGAIRYLLHLMNDMPKLAEHMQTTIQFIGMLGVNARLACAEIAGDDGSIFAFADQIGRTTGQVRDRVATLHATLVMLRTQCQAAVAAHSGLPADDAGETLPQRVAVALGGAEARRARTARSAADVQMRAAEMHGNVSDAVRAMQLGDITRQRIEHVQRIANLLAPPPPGAPVALGWAIAVAQLRDIAQTLDRDADSIGQALGRLTEEAADVTRLSNAAFGAGSGSYLGVLQDEVRQIGTTLSALHSACSAADVQIASVQRAAAEVARQIGGLREMEADIHLTGLNASLRCTRLGEAGKPLGVIAQMLRQGGRDIAAAADTVRARLVDISSQAAELADGRRRGVLDSIGRLGATMTAAVEKLAAADHALVDALRHLDADNGKLSAMLAEAIAEFSVREEIAGTLRQVADQMADWGSPADASDSADAHAQMLNDIAAGYTMARERVVHAAVTGMPLVETGPDPAPGADLELEALLL